jgi:hypothetical protein
MDVFLVRHSFYGQRECRESCEVDRQDQFTSSLASKTVQLNSARLQFALLVGITTVILIVVNVYCVSMQSCDLR